MLTNEALDLAIYELTAAKRESTEGSPRHGELVDAIASLRSLKGWLNSKPEF